MLFYEDKLLKTISNIVSTIKQLIFWMGSCIQNIMQDIAIAFLERFTFIAHGIYFKGYKSQL